MTTHYRPEQGASIIHGLVNRVAVFALLVVLTFVLPRLMPGDPLELLLSSDVARTLTPSEVDHIRQQMGLSGSWGEQFLDYVSAVLKGDLGFSRHHAAPVADLLRGSAPWTLLLIFAALPMYLFAGVLGGIEAGRNSHGIVDRLVTGAMILLASIPPFASAVFLLLMFGVLWPVFPISGAQPLFPAEGTLMRIGEIARHAILPALALSLHEVVRFYFVSRGEAVSLSVRPFIVNARARGISNWRERFHYFGRNMAPMTLARISDSITTMFGTAFFVEVVFSYPGIGKLIYNAILERDYVLLQGAILGLAVIVLLLNWIIDVCVTTLAGRG